jgi:hypothetical protein
MARVISRRIGNLKNFGSIAFCLSGPSQRKKSMNGIRLRGLMPILLTGDVAR